MAANLGCKFRLVMTCLCNSENALKPTFFRFSINISDRVNPDAMKFITLLAFLFLRIRV